MKSWAFCTLIFFIGMMGYYLIAGPNIEISAVAVIAIGSALFGTVNSLMAFVVRSLLSRVRKN